MADPATASTSMRGILKQIRNLDRAGSSASAYEVRCDACDVSFPLGTKRCIHCGGRTGPGSIFQAQIAPDPQVVFAPTMEREPDPFPGVATETEEPVDLLEGLPEERNQPRGSIFRAFGNLSWFLIIAALYLYRSCAG